jgi:hypothetical protein
VKYVLWRVSNYYRLSEDKTQALKSHNYFTHRVFVVRSICKKVNLVGEHHNLPVKMIYTIRTLTTLHNAKLAYNFFQQIRHAEVVKSLSVFFGGHHNNWGKEQAKEQLLLLLTEVAFMN